MNAKYRVFLDKLIYSTVVSFLVGAVITVLWQSLEVKFYGGVQYRVVDDYILAIIMLIVFASMWSWLSNSGLYRLIGLFPLLSLEYLVNSPEGDKDEHVFSEEEIENLRSHNQFLILRVADLEQECDRLETLLREMYHEKAEDKEQV